MAVVPMPRSTGRIAHFAVRREDRMTALPGRGTAGTSVASVLLGTAIVAGSVLGLFLYDATRPFASGAATPPPLVIPVDPLPGGGSQPR